MASSHVYHQRMTEWIQATRMDGTISFAVPTTDYAAERYYRDPSPNNADALVSPDLLEASRQAVGVDVEVRAVDASVKPRCRLSAGAAIQVLITIGGVGGGVTTLAVAAKVQRNAPGIARSSYRL